MQFPASADVPGHSVPWPRPCLFDRCAAVFVERQYRCPFSFPCPIVCNSVKIADQWERVVLRDYDAALPAQREGTDGRSSRSDNRRTKRHACVGTHVGEIPHLRAFPLKSEPLKSVGLFPLISKGNSSSAAYTAARFPRLTGNFTHDPIRKPPMKSYK